MAISSRTSSGVGVVVSTTVPSTTTYWYGGSSRWTTRLTAPAFSVQYHPEAAPGPHDARYLFGAFRELMLAHPTRPAGAGAGVR